MNVVVEGGRGPWTVFSKKKIKVESYRKCLGTTVTDEKEKRGMIT